MPLRSYVYVGRPFRLCWHTLCFASQLASNTIPYGRHYQAPDLYQQMTRTLFALVLTITASVASYVQAIETIGFVLVPLNDSYCGNRGLSYLAKYPLEDIAEGTLVLNATNIDAKPNTTIYFQPCNSTDTPKAMNSSDPSTWLVTLPGQCAKFWANSTGIERCQFSAVTLQTSQLSEHCDNKASADLCNPLPTPAPAPSSAVPHEVVTAVFVITVGSLVASLI